MTHEEAELCNLEYDNIITIIMIIIKKFMLRKEDGN